MRALSARVLVLGIMAMPSSIAAQTKVPDLVAVVEAGPEISGILGEVRAEAGEGLSFGVGVVNPGGEALEFEWDLGNGTPVVAGRDRRAVTHRYMRHGAFTVSVRVSGSEGFSTTRSIEVEIRNAAPTIHGLSHEGPAQPGRPVSFQADATDPGDDDLTYRWDFGDGSPPVEGIDLNEPTHRYDRPGHYRVTLTVTDEEGLEAVRSITVGANPGFLGEVGGGVPPFSFAGAPGKAALMNALPGSRALPLFNIPLFTGAAPIGGGIVDLSDEHGVCFIMAGFWDDRSKAHINVAWTPASDHIFMPREYPVGWASAEGDRIPADQLMVNALILEIEPSYEDTRDGAENLQVFDLGSLGGLIGGAIEGAVGGAVGGRMGGILGRIFGGGDPGGGAQREIPQVGPGRNYQLTSSSGYIRTTRVSEDRLQGVMDVTLHGAWMGGEGSGEVHDVEVRGEFDWELDEMARTGLAGCGSQPFTLASHTPTIEEPNTSFDSPEITLSFTRPIRPASVNAQTIQVGYLSEGAGFERVEGTLLVDPDGRTVRFTPSGSLLDAVHYHVRVTGGNDGIRSAAGETLPEDYAWRFATAVDLLERER